VVVCHRIHIHTEELHFSGILHFAPKLSLLQKWCKDEWNRKVRGFIASLGEGDRPTYDCRKKGKTRICQDRWYWFLFKMFTSQIEATEDKWGE